MFFKFQNCANGFLRFNVDEFFTLYLNKKKFFLQTFNTLVSWQGELLSLQITRVSSLKIGNIHAKAICMIYQ